MDEKGKWIPWSHTLFIGLNRPANFYLQKQEERELTRTLEDILGFEVVVDFF
jgi:hypothetical protein